MPEELTAALSDSELRGKLLELIGNDLLGPAGGAKEEISERNVRDRYLVGVLAPQKQHGADASSSEPAPAPADEEDEDVPQIPDELAEGGDDAGDDGKADQDVPVSQAALPSSSTAHVWLAPAASRIAATPSARSPALAGVSLSPMVSVLP